jgi:hypothetical protein
MVAKKVKGNSKPRARKAERRSDTVENDEIDDCALPPRHLVPTVRPGTPAQSRSCVADAENLSKIPLDMDDDAGGGDSDADEEVFALEGADRLPQNAAPLQCARSLSRRARATALAL